MSTNTITMQPAHPKIRTARYSFMAAQAIIWVVIFPVSIVMAGDIVQIGLHSALGLAMLIYVPHALSISLHNRTSSRSRPFDHAGGEVAYLALTIAGWLASFIWAIFVVTVDDVCVEWYDREDYWFAPGCATTAAVAALGLVQVIISSTWLAMIVWMVGNVRGQSRDVVYRISVNRLLRGSEPVVPTGLKNGPMDHRELDEIQGSGV